MKTTILLLSVLVGVMSLTDKEVNQQWTSFKMEYRKYYASALDEMVRLNIFKQNLEKIEAHNQLFESGDSTHTMGVTKFADLTATEFLKYFIFNNNTETRKYSLGAEFKPSTTADVPDAIDWREKGAVTPVTNQGQIGSSWVFPIVGALEALNALKNENLTPLSQQNLIDCVCYEECDGGFTDCVYDYVRDNGIETAADYPIKAGDGTCKFDKTKSVLTISGSVNILTGSEGALKEAVGTIQPVSIAIEASMELQLYKSGILEDSSCRNTEAALNHGVLVAGYGTEGGQDYWLIKNSWGTSWGEEGYFRLVRNSKNRCGVATAASYPLP